jgi:hypothetical protein
MADLLDSWGKARDFALTLPGTARKGGRIESVVIAENGQFFVFEGRETDTSFAVQIDLETIDMLKETEPETYWQSKHYEGWPAVLVRYDSADPERVRHVIGQAYEQAKAKAKKPARKRKT